MRRILLTVIFSLLLSVLFAHTVFACNIFVPSEVVVKNGWGYDFKITNCVGGEKYTMKFLDEKNNLIKQSSGPCATVTKINIFHVELLPGKYRIETKSDSSSDTCSTDNSFTFAVDSDAECGSGYHSPVQCRDQGICCKGNASGCEYKTGHPVAITSCEDVKKWATQVTSATCKSGTLVKDSSGKYVCRTRSAGNIMEIFLCLAGKPCATAIGDIDVSTPTKLIEVIMKLIVGIAGGIALIMLIFAGYQVAMSSGDPQKLQVAREIFVSVLTGIALIALSMVLLKAIGVDLLGLPPLEQNNSNFVPKPVGPK